MKTLKICLALLCLLPILAVGLPQFRGANFYMASLFISSKKFPEGFVVLFDDCNLEKVQKYHWYPVQPTHSPVYAEATYYVDGKKHQLYMHRYLFPNEKKLLVDHINRNGLDNRSANIRHCTPYQNSLNREKSKLNTTGFKGVTIRKRDGTYRAILHKNKKYITGGTYKTAIEAAIAYNKIATEHFGEFAYLNEIPS